MYTWGVRRGRSCGSSYTEEADEKRRQKHMKKKAKTVIYEEPKWVIFSFEEEVCVFRWIVFPVQTNYPLLRLDDKGGLSSLQRINPVFQPPKVHHHGGDPLLVTTAHVHTFLSEHEARDYSVAVIDSVMYTLGGFRHFKRSVQTFDLLAPSKGGGEIVEQCGPAMMRARCTPLVLVLNKKLYVFGGHISPSCDAYRNASRPLDPKSDSDSDFDYHYEYDPDSFCLVYESDSGSDSDKEGPWGEMYDPLTRRWCPIESPQGDYFPDLSCPFDCPIESFWATMHSTSSASIIFGSYECPYNLVLYELNELSVQWTETMIALPVLPDFYDSYGLGSAVAIGRTLLWFAPQNGLLVALNLDHGILFAEKFKSFLDPRITDFTDLNPRLTLLHEGKDGEPSVVCLIFADVCLPIDIDNREQTYLLHCLKMKVQIDPEMRSIVSSMLDCQCAHYKANWPFYFRHASMG